MGLSSARSSVDLRRPSWEIILRDRNFEVLLCAEACCLGVILVTAYPLLGSSQNFTVPDDIALRIRLDDTLTSTDSEVGDPFSATVVDTGDYQRARAICIGIGNSVARGFKSHGDRLNLVSETPGGRRPRFILEPDSFQMEIDTTSVRDISRPLRLGLAISAGHSVQHRSRLVGRDLWANSRLAHSPPHS